MCWMKIEKHFEKIVQMWLEVEESEGIFSWIVPNDKNWVPILEKCYRSYDSAMITLNNNLVFLNLIIDAMGRL